ncbi:hypothetical protein EB001_17985, partial [bacterium]|nr:hypothetical protein [bacterium]
MAKFVGEVIKAYPSQSAALQQWQDSAGSVLAQIGAGGDLFMSIATRAFFGGASGAGYVNISSSGNGGRQGLVIQGAASQTVNLQEWQN